MEDGYIVTIHTEDTSITNKVEDRLHSLENDLKKFGIEIKHENEVSYTNEAIDELKRENYDEGLEKLRKAEKINPNYPAIYLHKSLAQYRKKNIDAALSSINRAIEKVERWTDARYHKAILHFEKEEYEKAADEFQHVMDIMPENQQVYEDICCMMDYNKPELAIESGEIAARMDSDDYHVHYHLAIAYRLNDEEDKSISTLDELIENSEDTTQVARAKLQKCSSLIEKDETIEVINTASSIINHHEDDYAVREAYSIRGIERTFISEYEKAINDLTEYIEDTNIQLNESDESTDITNYPLNDELSSSKDTLAKTHFCRGISRLKLDRNMAGQKDIRKAVTHNSKYAERLNELEISQNISPQITNLDAEDVM